jgi:hypothetical protein
VSPSFLWIDGGGASAVWRFSKTINWVKVFFFHFVHGKKITRHTQCGCVQASLHAVRDLADVIGLSLLTGCVALRIDDMVLTLCLIVF